MRRNGSFRVRTFSQIVIVGVLSLAAGQMARADDLTPQANSAAKSAYSLLNPTPDKDLRDLSADRPGKFFTPITVDAGRLQIESDFVSYTHQNVQKLDTGTFEFLDPELRLGVLSNVELDASFNGDELVRARHDGATHTRNLDGFGDVFFRARVNLFGNDGGDVAFAVSPYVKLPSRTAAALAIGDGVVEGGNLSLLQVKLPQGFTLGVESEIDALEGGMSSKRFANFAEVLSLQHEVPGVKHLTATAEFFASDSVDRFTPAQYTADVALAYLLKPATQLDCGANFGLNRAAPNVQVYAGISHRF